MAGALNEAAAQYEGVLAVYPEVPAAHNNLGAIHFRQSKFGLAETEFKQAVALDPDYTDAQYNLGAAYFKQGFMAKARPHFEKAVLLDPKHASARKHLGFIELKDGNDAAAIEHFRVTVTGAAPPVDAAHQLAWVLATSKNLELREPSEAVRLAGYCVDATQASQSSMVETLAIAHASAGEFPAAIERLEQAIAMATNHHQKRIVLQDLLRRFKDGLPYEG